MELILENGKTFLKGIMAESNFGKNDKGTDFSFRGRNRNGRLYPHSILAKSVMELIEKVKKSDVLCYRDHPNHTDMIYNDSCARFDELTWDDDAGRAYCKVEILEDTAFGKQVLEDLRNGIDYGISTRSLGSLNENKEVTSLNIVTADLIPVRGGNIQSCQSCTMSIHESIQANYDDFFVEVVQDCKCKFNQLDIAEKVKVREHFVDSIVGLFK